MGSLDPHCPGIPWRLNYCDLVRQIAGYRSNQTFRVCFRDIYTVWARRSVHIVFAVVKIEVKYLRISRESAAVILREV